MVNSCVVRRVHVFTIAQEDTAGLPTVWKRQKMWCYETLLDFTCFSWPVMSDSYLLDLSSEPPSSWIDAPFSVAHSYNPDKQNTTTWNVFSSHRFTRSKGNQVKPGSGSEPLLPEGVVYAARSWLLFIASFDVLQDPAGADSWTAG